MNEQKTKDSLSVNLTNLFLDKIGDNGISKDEWSSISPKLTEVQTEYFSQIDQLGYTHLPEEFETLSAHITRFSEFLGQIPDLEELIILGIGGSDLGARAIKSALVDLNPNFISSSKLKVTFSGDTTDPAMLKVTFSKINYAKTQVLVISKSGNTLEQASNFVYLYDQFSKNIPDFQAKLYFAFITDAKSGTLVKFAINNGNHGEIVTFPVPDNVGGRFSVLSTVGMLPASLMGLNVQRFLSGAKNMKDRLYSDFEENNHDIALEYAATQFILAEKHNNISVLFPYNYQLKVFGDWYRQLWAESLGKNGRGTTPVVALGPVDQHSQLQLYNEGPNDKSFTFLYAYNQQFDDFKLPNIKEKTQFSDYHYFSGEKFSKLLEYELRTTRYALTMNGRPNSIITIPEVNEFHLGELFYFMETVVSYMGLLFGVNAYDQPGVELSKNAMYSILNKPGYEAQLDDDSLNLIKDPL